eukprot:2934060-Pyramimonas_sp.AAC.1
MPPLERAAAAGELEAPIVYVGFYSQYHQMFVGQDLDSTVQPDLAGFVVMCPRFATVIVPSPFADSATPANAISIADGPDG